MCIRDSTSRLCLRPPLAVQAPDNIAPGPKAHSGRLTTNFICLVVCRWPPLEALSGRWPYPSLRCTHCASHNIRARRRRTPPPSSPYAVSTKTPWTIHSARRYPGEPCRNAATYAVLSRRTARWRRFAPSCRTHRSGLEHRYAEPGITLGPSSRPRISWGIVNHRLMGFTIGPYGEHRPANRSREIRVLTDR